MARELRQLGYGRTAARFAPFAALITALAACRSAPQTEHAPEHGLHSAAPLPSPPRPLAAAQARGAQAPAIAALGSSSSAGSNSALAFDREPPALPPLSGNWIEAFDEPDRGAVVTLPLGARAPRQIVLGVHGAGDRPEWSCGGWRLASAASTFVLCPRGRKMDPQRFAWSSSSAIEQALDAALAELKRRYGDYLDESALVYAGFSQGATLAEPILRARARQLPIAILAEGGYATSRSADFARAYHAGGGRRVVLVCGTGGCFQSAAGAKPVLEKAGLEVLIVGDERAGHNLNARMQAALQAAWPRMVAPLSPAVQP